MEESVTGLQNSTAMLGRTEDGSRARRDLGKSRRLPLCGGAAWGRRCREGRSGAAGRGGAGGGGGGRHGDGDRASRGARRRRVH